MTLLRQTQKCLSRDSICDVITLISNEYKTLYAEVKREIKERAILSRCKVQRLTVAYICSKRRKMRYNYNPKTRLRNNNRYAKAVTLKREVEFKDKRSSIYYYIKIADIATKLYKATFVIKLLI
ncbi:hypothetical protein HBI80_246150 [Parastagonospora nodorum]|nr:hypothetical protein HBI80_246150 [Parastagonospora nodorum]